MLCQVALEGNLVNLDVTAPGAILALGLMYLKTNDAAIARTFSIPDTHFALDYVKPELIVLRVLARGLVMWDEVAATKEWVDSQLPDIMKVSFSKYLFMRKYISICQQAPQAIRFCIFVSSSRPYHAENACLRKCHVGGKGCSIKMGGVSARCHESAIPISKLMISHASPLEHCVT